MICTICGHDAGGSREKLAKHMAEEHRGAKAPAAPTPKQAHNGALNAPAQVAVIDTPKRTIRRAKAKQE